MIFPQKEWYVVFEPRRGKRRWWWHFFGDPLYSHVWLMCEVADGSRSLMLNRLRGGVLVAESVRSCAVEVEHMEATAVLRYFPDPTALYSDRLRPSIGSCVTFAKNLLFIDGIFIKTPYALYKELLALGAERVV